MNKVKGTAYTIYSSVAFGIMPFLTKFAYDGGANAVTTLMFRFFDCRINFIRIFKI